MLTDVSLQNVTKNDLAIPDTYCSPNKAYGHSCPSNMICIELPVEKHGFAGFDNLCKSTFDCFISSCKFIVLFSL